MIKGGVKVIMEPIKLTVEDAEKLLQELYRSYVPLVDMEVN